MSILLLGAKGQLGFELHQRLTPSHWGPLYSLSRDELDLNNLDQLHSSLERLQPTIIFNASAYTAVDKAESMAEEADRINHLIPKALATYAKVSKASLVHFSTDFVFDGLKSSPYVETDATAPLSVYGQSKLAGELAIQESGCQHLIFRTGWLMGEHGQNFLKSMLRLAKVKTELKVVCDQRGAPTPANWLAQASIEALHICLDPKSTHPLWGLYHASAQGETTWHAYAKEAISYAQHLGFKQTLNAQDVLPIPSSEYPLPAKRPNYSVLNGEKLENAFGLQRPLWTQAVHEVIQGLAQSDAPL